MKTRTSFTIDEGLFDSFVKYCEDNFINRSELIEGFIDNFLTEKQNER